MSDLKAMQFRDWQTFEAWLGKKGLFHMDFGLGRIQAALKQLQLESPAFPLIQILGTNGKGSTSAFLESLARAHGLNTGLYTSPHFLCPRERIRLNAEQIPEEEWLLAARQVLELPCSESLTYFETLTLLAVILFSRADVDLAILEAGLGGEHDATSALPAFIHCYCPIAMDHASVIGPCLSDIARDKARAIQARTLVVSAPQYPQAERILREEAERADADFVSVNPLGSETGAAIGLKGEFQLLNAAVALAAWRAATHGLGLQSMPEREAGGLGGAFLPGRMQPIPAARGHPHLLLDGAHNPHGIRALIGTLETRPAAAIFTALRDKDWRASVGLLVRLRIPLIIPQLPCERAASAEEIAAWANAIRPGSATATSDLREALFLCNWVDGQVLVCGSLYLLAEVYNIFPQYLERT